MKSKGKVAYKVDCNFPDDFYESNNDDSYYSNSEINNDIREMILEIKKQNINWIKRNIANDISIIIIRTGNTYDITVATRFYEAEIDE